MSIESLIEILRAHMAKEGLVFCKATDTQFPIDGLREAQLLRDVVEVIDDARGVVLEWVDAETTTPVPSEVLKALAGAA